MKRLLGAILALAALSGVASAGSGLAGWRYLAPVETGGKTGPVNISVAPDSPLWEKGSTELADLRIVDDQGQGVPYLLWRPQPGTATTARQGTLINAGRDEATKQSTATLDLGENPPTIDRIQIGLGLQGRYLLAVQVAGSHDQKDWVQLPTADLLYDLTPQGGERSDLIRFQGPVQLRYLRLLVPDLNGRPTTVQSVTVTAAQTKAPPREQAFAGKPSVSRDTARKLTIMTLDMTSRRRADEVELITSSRSFFRRVSAEGSSDGQNWQRLAGTMLYSYEADGQRRVRTALTLAGCQCRYLRLLVEDGDDAPLADPEIRVTAIPSRIFFEAQPGRSYRLYLGNPEAPRPQYDLARMPVNPEAGTAVSLGALADNPDFQAALPPVTDRFPWLLPGVLALTVLIVGAGLVQMARRIRARDSQDSDKRTPD